jgi:ribosomal protein S18 acetylase RimI-like enzyme
MIRPVTKEDLPAIVRLFRELWPTEPLTADEMAPVLDMYLHDNDYELFCFEKDTIVGIITVSKRWAFFHRGRVGVIEELIVSEGCRGQGIGKKLTRFVEERLSEQGITGVELTSDLRRKQTHRFWEHLGYERRAFQFRKRMRH